jgi:hypothetical protein
MKKNFKNPPPPGSSYSNEYLLNRDMAPLVSTSMVKGVSNRRREILQDEVVAGVFRDGTGSNFSETGLTYNSVVSASVGGFKKNAQVLSGGGGMHNGYGGAGNTIKQIPEVYSPLWLSSNLNLPRDRATINAWCRAFFALNPFVHNAISLHSTYPISKLQIKCHNQMIQNFFNDMSEELDLMNVCIQIAQEYFLLGEAFPYAEFDSAKGVWSRIIIQNPDNMIVNRSVVASEPIIMLKPDLNLQNIVRSNKPSDIEQKKQLSQHIIDSVKRGKNIMLDNFHVSHLARKIAPYEVRGTGLPVCIFRQLMLMDKLRESKYAQADNLINPLTLVKIGSEGQDGLHPSHADIEYWREVFECHDEETEVLTSEGFKKFDEVISFSEAMDGTYNTSYITHVAPIAGVKIACFNSNNEQLEYHEPTGASVYNYSGDMYHFANEKLDIKVTPNHKMWVSRKEYEYHGHRSLRKTKWGEWKKVEAQDIKMTDYNRTRSQVKWEGNDDVKFVDVCGKQIPIELYLEFLGYVLSEGCVFTNGKCNSVGIYQTYEKFQQEMSNCINNFAKILDKKVYNTTSKRTHINKNWKDVWCGTINNKDVYDHFVKEVGDSDGRTKSYYKKIPRWVLNLSTRLLNILLDALVKGDGSVYLNPNKKSNRFAYYSTSKQLADDVYEVVYKCGLVPTSFVRDGENYTNREDYVRVPLHTVLWSNSGKGKFPLVYKTSRNSQTKEKRNLLTIEKYDGKVWCFEVPTGLFITRRGGKITVQANSAQYDKDFKIFTHPGVTIERVGAGQGIYDISGDITQLVKEIYVGLQVPSVLMDGGADVTYSNGGVALDVLRQRYMSFRNILSAWLKRKIFAPISKFHDFYEFKEGSSGKQEKHLIVPDIDWNHMSLFDAGDYINTLVQLTAPAGEGVAPRVSTATLYRSLGLEEEDEVRKLRKEAKQAAINKKEAASLAAMTLPELRSLGDDDEIPEVKPPPGQNGQGENLVPGEVPPGGAPPGMPPPPDMGLPGLGALPPPPSGGPPPGPPGPPPGAGPPPPPPTPPAGAPPK